MSSVLEQTAHRPDGLPTGAWFMGQRWHDLLFAHWRVSGDTLRELVPEPLEIDLFDGWGWVGVVPFTMRNVRFRRLPPIPWLSAFPELNVRTYVTFDGKPGVYFFSLDAGNPVAVAAARHQFHLPYYRARMRTDCSDVDRVRYQSIRTHRGEPPAEFAAVYQPHGEPYQLTPGTLDNWFIERYRLFTLGLAGEVIKSEIHHPPWRIQSATAEFLTNTMTAGIALDHPADEPLLHFSKFQDMVVWRPEVVG